MLCHEGCSLPKHSQYREAFFGVDLNQKFEDTIRDIRDVETGLKKLSLQIARLGETKGSEVFNESIKECRAVADEKAREVKDIRTFLDFLLKV